VLDKKELAKYVFMVGYLLVCIAFANTLI